MAPTLFNFYFDTDIHMALDVHRQEERGIKVAYLLDTDLVGNRRSLKLETLVTYLEYAYDMALLVDNWADLTTMLDSLATTSARRQRLLQCSQTQVPRVQHPFSWSQEVSLLKWYPTFSIWAALSRMTVGWMLRSVPGYAKPHLHSIHCPAFCGVSKRSRPVPRFAS